MIAGVLAPEDGSPGGAAQGARHEGIFERNLLVGQQILRLGHEPEVVGPHIAGEYEEYVGLASRLNVARLRLTGRQPEGRSVLTSLLEAGLLKCCRRRAYGSGCPPVTPKVSPLTKLDSWEARNTKAGASSAGWAGRPIGEVAPNWETVSPGMEAGMIGVHTGPGATVFALSP